MELEKSTNKKRWASLRYIPSTKFFILIERKKCTKLTFHHSDNLTEHFGSIYTDAVTELAL
jgi:hypothetical protein